MVYSFNAKKTHVSFGILCRMAEKKAIRLLIVICMITFSGQMASFAEDGHQHHAGPSASPSHDPSHEMKHPDTPIHPKYPEMFKTDMLETENNIRPAANSGETGITEKLGQFISADIKFLDENGKSLVLGNFIDRPTLILPIFYHCPKTCSLLLSNLSNALNDVTFTAGQSYRVLAFSFDDEESPEDAKHAKRNYLNLLKKDFPESDWRFLTGNFENIQALADAMGFKFKKLAPHSFVHPNILLCVSGDRKIIRYLYGPDFLPFDISMAIAEAERGTPGISIKKIVSFCFDYDPKGKRYVFRTFRISGILIISLLAVFIFFLVRKKPSDQRKNKKS